MSGPLDLATELMTSFSAPPPARAGQVRRDRPDRAGLGDTITFPVTGHPRSDLLSTLRRRHSTRFYSGEAVDARLLADVLARGLVDDADSWAAEHECCPLSLDVVAFRVDGLESGMYALDPLALSFTALAPLPPREALRDMTIQSEFCDSAAIITVTGDLEHAAETHGGHGYRMLMTRAGAAAYAAWLEAVACGLVGTVFAGFIPSSVRVPLHCDGSSRHQLFALALGTPAGANPEIGAGGTAAGHDASERR
ncbi:hypothetical protein Skr01_21570 [Sphaerisporangium krabiense]|uniref:Nitroreductase domain-containing protein n=1 Tax=Sphaerisporangium krabiense TaxID=763782 RepID=A0A7W8Z5L7_9ACTN|nr:nitroreductase family protein [Sphaerisporangium krabiense]MBB5627912.1 hypothetical protein [Sphaerisporangium krabiense]GII62072.1 hypothetical protein Skr01_21570 [Sphaerisporangium krabiense]